MAGEEKATTGKSRGRIYSVAIFYAVVYFLWVALYYAPPSINGSDASVPGRTVTVVVTMVPLLVLVYAINRGKSGSTLSMMGLGTKGILNSFLWANAFLLPIMIAILGMVAVAGPQSVLSGSSLPLPSPVPLWYPLFALIPFVLNGFLDSSILQAFPYETLAAFPKRYVVPLIAVLWSGLYNAAFLTGTLRWDDILFFGLLWTIAYHKSRNSIGLLAAYALAESPVSYVIAMAWGIDAFDATIVLRTALSLGSVAVLAISYTRSRRKPAPGS